VEILSVKLGRGLSRKEHATLAANHDQAGPNRPDHPNFVRCQGQQSNMIYAQAIVIGAGPAGAATAFELKKKSVPTLLLDKSIFPRNKVCAGWITPGVLEILDLTPRIYPHSITEFDRLHFHLLGQTMAVKTRQYAIRRYEFDRWMVKRAKRIGVKMDTHRVERITRINGKYVIDDRYTCDVLIGAGGTHCPVQRALFNDLHPRSNKSLIAAVEAEYRCKALDRRCHIWFFHDKVPGYGWYLPKQGGYVNVGIGGKFLRLKQQGRTIMDHWQSFTATLLDLGILSSPPPHPKGHIYFLRQPSLQPRIGNALLVGDAAGLATLDMGEGIAAAIASGIQAAEAITEDISPSLDRLPRFSTCSFI
jgi:flavin-dependent dehydrogenase